MQLTTLDGSHGTIDTVHFAICAYYIDRSAVHAYTCGLLEYMNFDIFILLISLLEEKVRG